jgi:YHS domain-containing protein
MKSRLLIGALAVAVIIGARSWADEKTKDAKCPVSGQAVKADKSVEFEGGKVYFCCGNCPKTFEKDKEKYAAKARHQMVQTGEMEQVHCPITHKAFKDGTELTVSGVEIKFCCNNCRGKVEKMTEDEQVKACFAEADCFKAAEN